MKLVPWDPFAEMEEMMNMHNRFVPAVDMYETKDAVMIEMPLAGIDTKDVEVSVENGVLTVQGKSKKEHEVEEKNYYRKEIRSGSFFRQVALPVAVKEDEVEAVFEDGLLKVTCPKTAPSQAKKVNIKVVKKNDEKK